MTSPKTSLAAVLGATLALGGFAAAGPAHAATIESGAWNDTARTPRGGHDVFTDGARGTDERDTFTDGARALDDRDVFTGGARGTGPRDPFTHGG